MFDSVASSGRVGQLPDHDHGCVECANQMACSVRHVRAPSLDSRPLAASPDASCVHHTMCVPSKPKRPTLKHEHLAQNTSLSLSLFRHRTVDFITDFYVIVITPLVMAGLIVAVGFARVARNPEKRNGIAYIHGSLILLLSFLVLPATSMKVRTRCVK